MKNHQRAVVGHFKGLIPGNVLDVATGTGAVSVELKRLGFKVASTDLYETPVDRAGFVRADLNAHLPFGDAIFDYVLCMETLQYIENHALFFRETARVLKSGATAVITTPNVLSASSRAYFLRRGYFPHFKPARFFKEGRDWDALSYNPISLVDIYELAARSGFAITGVKATRIKLKNVPLALLLKALYAPGLIFERNERKAELVRKLSSFDALAGDNLLISLKRTGGQG